VTEIITNSHKPRKVCHGGLFTSSYHNSLRLSSLAWLAWNARKSWVIVWSRDLRAQKPGKNAWKAAIELLVSYGGSDCWYVKNK